MDETNGWDQYKKLVISELGRTNNRLDTMDKRLSKIERNIVALQTKAAAWAASISVVISLGAALVFKML